MEGITEQEKADLANFHAYTKNMGIMQSIVREMKEIAELPSEVPTDTQALERVEFPSQGGVLTYMSGHEYPYKGFPFFEFVDKIDVIKKIQRATLSSLFHSLKARPYWQLAGLVFVPWIFKDLVTAYLYTFYRQIDRFKVKKEKYSDAIRELHRSFSMEWMGEDPKVKEMRLMVRDIMCMFLEFDNAYRFRFQDIIVNLDVSALKQNTGNELVRLFELMTAREKTQEIKDTWKLVKFFLPWYLRFDKKLQTSIVGVLSSLDLTKVKLSVEDEHFCLKRTDYQFDFMSWPQNLSTSVKDSPPQPKQSPSQPQELSQSGLPTLETASS